MSDGLRAVLEAAANGLDHTGSTGGTDAEVTAFVRWVLGADGESPLSPKAAYGLAADDALATLLLELGARRYFLAMDGERLARWVEAFECAAPIEARLWREAVAVCRGEAPSDLAELAQEARQQARPRTAVTAVALSVLAANDAPDQLTGHARRAWRMARAEGCAPLEILAAVLLARARRLGSAPYAARHVLLSLFELGPGPARDWAACELLLAGGQPQAGGARSLSLATLLGARGEGQLAAALPGAVNAFASFRPLLADVERAAVLLGVGDPATCPWCLGDEPVAPRGLFGLADALPVDDETRQTHGYVVAQPGQPGRRVLANAVHADLGTNGVRLEPHATPRERTDAACASLLLARDPAVSLTGFFRDLYGFPYDEVVHRATFDQLIHRVRERFGDAASLERQPDQLVFELHRPIVAWDPRCARPLEDRLLGLLASRGATSSDEAAGALGVSKRAIQEALRRLVEDGACAARREGRRVGYVVEDTVFSTLTRKRFASTPAPSE